MKSERLLPILLGLLAGLIQGCETYPKSGQPALVGSWKNSIGTVWTLRDDGTFDADLDNDGKRDGWGKYTVDGDIITMWRTGGIDPKGCAGKGIYGFNRKKENLRFTLVSDTCRLRKQNVLLIWRRT